MSGTRENWESSDNFVWHRTEFGRAGTWFRNDVQETSLKGHGDIKWERYLVVKANAKEKCIVESSIGQWEERNPHGLLHDGKSHFHQVPKDSISCHSSDYYFESLWPGEYFCHPQLWGEDLVQWENRVYALWVLIIEQSREREKGGQERQSGTLLQLGKACSLPWVSEFWHQHDLGDSW